MPFALMPEEAEAEAGAESIFRKRFESITQTRTVSMRIGPKKHAWPALSLKRQVTSWSDRLRAQSLDFGASKPKQTNLSCLQGAAFACTCAHGPCRWPPSTYSHLHQSLQSPAPWSRPRAPTCTRAAARARSPFAEELSVAGSGRCRRRESRVKRDCSTACLRFWEVSRTGTI